MNAAPTPTPDPETERTSFRLKNPLNVSGRQLPRGTVVATVECPAGISVTDALQTIRCGQAVTYRIV